MEASDAVAWAVLVVVVVCIMIAPLLLAIVDEEYEVPDGDDGEGGGTHEE